MASKRIVWIDYSRAFSIIMVVTIHAFLAIERIGPQNVHGMYTETYALVERAIYSFNMPLSFLLAGVTARLTAHRGPAATLRSLASNYLWPYFIWSLLLLLLKLIFVRETAMAPADTDPLSMLLRRPIDQMWFLYSLLLIRLVWVAIEAAGRPWLRHAAAALSLAVAFAGAGPSDEVVGIWLMFWGAFYGLGRELDPAAVNASPKRLRLAIALLAVPLWVALLLWPRAEITSSFGPTRTLFGLFGSAASVALISLLPLSAGRLSRFAGLVGEASMAIYVTHTLAGTLARLALVRLGVDNAAVLILAYTLSGLLLPTFAYAAVLALSARLSLPLLRLVGFGTARGSAYFNLVSAAARRG